MLSLLPHLLTLIASFSLCLYAWQRRYVLGARPFVIITAGQVVWIFGLIQELTTPDLSAKLFWDHFQWAGTFSYVLGLLVFVLEVGQRRLVHFNWKWGVVILPVALFWLAGWPPAWLAQITPEAEIVSSQPFDLLFYPFGMLHLAVSVYSYLLFFVAMGLGVRSCWCVHPLYRRQLFSVLLGSLFPFVIGLLGLLGWLPWFGQRDLHPYTFAFSDLLFIISVFGYRVFDLALIANKVIFQKLRDPVLVFGPDGVLNAINSAACDLFDLSPNGVVGHTAADVFASYPELLDFIECQQEGSQKIELGGRKSRSFYELTLVHLRSSRGLLYGWIAIFHKLSILEDAQQQDTFLQRFTLELDQRQTQQAVIAEMTAQFNFAHRPELVLQALSQALGNLGYDTFSVWKCRDEDLLWYQDVAHLPDWLILQVYELTRQWAKVDKAKLTIPLEAENKYTCCYHNGVPEVLRSIDEILMPVFVQDKKFTELPIWLQTLSRELIVRWNITEHYVFPLGHYGIVFLNSSTHVPSVEQLEWVQLICQQAGVALDRLQAIDAYQTLNTELEQRIRERTAQLQSANKELEAFAYSVSHDLRAPLRAMHGFSDMLATDYTDRLDEKGIHLLQRIQDSAKHMSDLIDALLTLSRLSRGEMRLTTVNLSQLAIDIVSALQQDDKQRQVECHIKNDLWIRADKELLQVVLENLLSNAWKFTSQCEQACIEVGDLVDEDGLRVFYVRDNGIGFDMAYVDKLFVAFQRLHSLEEFPGSGIGLTTVQRIIYRHAGRIWAQAEVGQGATFYFTLWD